jgi:hypothetical protein
MRSLLLGENLHPSNQYILVRVIQLFPFCKNVFVPSKSPVKVQGHLLVGDEHYCLLGYEYDYISQSLKNLDLFLMQEWGSLINCGTT